MRDFDGRGLVVTGAGSGLGQAVALEAAHRGAHVLLVGRREEALVETARACQDAGGRACVLALDVGGDDAPARIVKVARAELGRIDGLVNNAALARFGELTTFPDEWLDAMYRVNLRAPLRLIREALPELRRVKGGVVNVSSIGGAVSTPKRVVYGALKAALSHATRSLARELAPDVRVTAVLPGPLRTAMWKTLGLDASGVAELEDEMIRTTPAGRLGDAQEVAPWICELLSERGRWLTGSLLTVDGGRSA
jgi:NAD(P)-dependent dehydrogenase (short-subunit alcohol dehydrogenase family)